MTMRPDLNRHNRVCDCGEQAHTVLYYATFQVRNGRRDRRTRRIPLCPAHERAHVAQNRQRTAAIARTWNS